MSHNPDPHDETRVAGPARPGELIVVGGGMVAQRLVEALRDRDADGRWRITVLAEEPRPPLHALARAATEAGLANPSVIVIGDVAAGY